MEWLLIPLVFLILALLFRKKPWSGFEAVDEIKVDEPEDWRRMNDH